MSSSDDSDDDRDGDELLRDFEAEGQAIKDSLLPIKSAARYQATYDKFIKWMSQNKTAELTKDLLLVYFTELAMKKKAPSLWSDYSMIRSVVNLKYNFDIGNYVNLKSLLRNNMKGYEAKKSRVFTWAQFQTFLQSDNFYLAMKVLLIRGIFGALRTCEMTNLRVQDVQRITTVNEKQEEQMLFVFSIENTKTYHPRKFVVGREYVKVIDFYIKARPDDFAEDRFFYRYEKKGIRQVLGKNWIRAVPKTIAEYLNLNDPHQYTGHCFRRTAATLLAETGANEMMLKELGGWKSTAVMQGYIQDSFFSKVQLFEKFDGSIGFRSAQINTPALRDNQSERATHHVVKTSKKSIATKNKKSTSKVMEPMVEDPSFDEWPSENFSTEATAGTPCDSTDQQSPELPASRQNPIGLTKKVPFAENNNELNQLEPPVKMKKYEDVNGSSSENVPVRGTNIG
ncbi:hypothetical protein QAD02_006787 [Eretmocerus hayati]|uniref:Uncharacterized protein n=1 Tax=Eretmocerus hayati TaxID=131215 RepID=A0ACC2N1V0_9HYME|nr:hypothetical protein QAD02_006787 [Eretmocerus hayati]